MSRRAAPGLLGSIGGFALAFVGCQALVGSVPEEIADAGGEGGAIGFSVPIAGSKNSGGSRPLDEPSCDDGDGICKKGCSWGLDSDCSREWGDPCDEPSQCPGGVCVEGVCCNSLCQGECESCVQREPLGYCQPKDFSEDPENCGGCGRECDHAVCREGECAEVVLGRSQRAGTKDAFQYAEFRCLDVATDRALLVTGLGIATTVEGTPLRLALYSGEQEGFRLIVPTQELRSGASGTEGLLPDAVDLPAGEYFVCVLAEDYVYAFFSTGMKFEFAALHYGEFPSEAPLTQSTVGSFPHVYVLGFQQ